MCTLFGEKNTADTDLPAAGELFYVVLGGSKSLCLKLVLFLFGHGSDILSSLRFDGFSDLGRLRE